MTKRWQRCPNTRLVCYRSPIRRHTRIPTTRTMIATLDTLHFFFFSFVVAVRMPNWLPFPCVCVRECICTRLFFSFFSSNVSPPFCRIFSFISSPTFPKGWRFSFLHTWGWQRKPNVSHHCQKRKCKSDQSLIPSAYKAKTRTIFMAGWP